MSKEIIFKPLTEKAWNELEAIRKQCGFKASHASYAEYLEEYEKRPVRAVLF